MSAQGRHIFLVMREMKYLTTQKARETAERPARSRSEGLHRCVRRQRAACPGHWLVRRLRPSADWSRPDRSPRSRRQGRGRTRTWTDASTVDLHRSCSHQRDDRSPPRGRDAPRDVDQAVCRRNMLRLRPTDVQHRQIIPTYLAAWWRNR